MKPRRPSKTAFPPSVLKDNPPINCEAWWEHRCDERMGLDADHACPRSRAGWHPLIASSWNLRWLCRASHSEATRRRDLYAFDKNFLDMCLLAEETIVAAYSMRPHRILIQRWMWALAPHYKPLRRTVATSGRWEWVEVGQ